MSQEPDHPSFGELLRIYRERSVDKRAKPRLSQDIFALRLSEKTGLIVTRNKVSNWETEKTRIAVNDRDILLSILAVLHEHGGITSIDEANQMLEAGNYRSLSPIEVQQLFFYQQFDPTAQQTLVRESIGNKTVSSVPESPWLKSWKELQRILVDAKVGPNLSWLRMLVKLTRAALDHWTIFNALHAIGWIWLWFLTWWLTVPSLRWPFHNQGDAIFGMSMYIGGTILLPPFIGFLTDPKNNELWRQQKSITRWVLYLYAYQGAGIGFHLGYFIAFLLALVSYQAYLRTATWFELLLALFPLLFGYMGAHLVPYNLWRAYGRLHLADGAIFFIFLILGPMWGYFFLHFYSYILIPTVGFIMILIAATSLVVLMAWRQRRTGSTLIPSYWWSLIYGSVLVLYEINKGENWYKVIAFAGLTILLSVLIALGRVKFTLKGMLVVTVGVGLLLIVLEFNIWIGCILAGLLIFIWWRWGTMLLSFPPSFWVVVLIYGICGWAMKQGLLSELLASIFIAIIALLTLLWERHRGF